MLKRFEHLLDNDMSFEDCVRLARLMDAILSGWITVAKPPLLGILWPGDVIYGLCPQ